MRSHSSQGLGQTGTTTEGGQHLWVSRTGVPKDINILIPEPVNIVSYVAKAHVLISEPVNILSHMTKVHVLMPKPVNIAFHGEKSTS